MGVPNLLVTLHKSPVFKTTVGGRPRGKMGTLWLNIFDYESGRGTAI